MSYKKEAYLKNLDWMTSELLKIASNKDLSLTEELKQITNLKQEYIKNKAELETEAKNTCAICQQEFDDWNEYNAHRVTHKPDVVKQPGGAPVKVSAFNREWNVTPIVKDSSIGYDVSDNTGKKVMHIKPANGKQWSEAELKLAIQNELTHGFKQGKLTEKVAFLEKGSKIVILSTSKDRKQVKFAELSNGVRGWIPASKVNIIGQEGQSVPHEGHTDKVLAMHETEVLIECPMAGVHWEKKNAILPTHDNSTTQPPATPESLNPDVTAEKDCPDCHGNFAGKENEKCPTCGRFSVEALKQQITPQLPTKLPPVLPNQRMDVNAATEKNARGCDQCEAAMINGVFCHETGCPNARKEREQEDMEMESSLNKVAIIVEENGKWCVRSPKNKNWSGGCFSNRAAAEKRLAEVERIKHMKGSLRPFSKKEALVNPHACDAGLGLKAEVLVDPYQELHTQVQGLRDRMTQVQERLQSNPLPKEAGNGEQDNSELDIPELLSDLTMGIDLLETKLQGNDVEQDVHPAIEEMENLLWSVEEKLNITPKLSEEEKVEPEHSSLVKELEEKEVEKESTKEVKADSLQTPPPPDPDPNIESFWDETQKRWLKKTKTPGSGSSYGM